MAIALPVTLDEVGVGGGVVVTVDEVSAEASEPVETVKGEGPLVELGEIGGILSGS